MICSGSGSASQHRQVELLDFTIASVTTDWITAIATALGALAATLGLAYAGLQLRAARQSAEGARREAESQFLLALEDQFRVHWDTHVALRPGGEWTSDNGGPKTAEDWARVESYMGLFERLNILRRNGLVSLPYIRQFYGYRLGNIWANKAIREGKNLENAPSDWADFMELSRELGKSRER